MRKLRSIEWPTVALFLVVYGVWSMAIFWLAEVSLWLAVPIAAVSIAFQGSLQHEALHGHPTGSCLLNTALAWPPLTLVIPYLRFRDTHLDHHKDASLTDPFEDPETNFLDGDHWARLPLALKALLTLNNTLAGRLLLGPAIGTVFFLRSDWSAWRADPRVAHGWLWHVPAVAVIVAIVWASPMPLWAYGVAVYVGLALLRIRTFLEHQAHEQARARSVIIEDRGPLALLFLNNNLHAVHHAHPGVAWYRLPALYRRHRERFLAMNGGYLFSSYSMIFRRYLFHTKDPVAHPLTARSD
ncbi:MAG: fatty acid desaturase [Paracoccaceae bacterium]|nr:fatty acid desaturase [Paracoccaceae bacterium]